MTDPSTGGYEAAGVVSSTQSPGEGELIARLEKRRTVLRMDASRFIRSQADTIERLTERVARMEEERRVILDKPELTRASEVLSLIASDDPVIASAKRHGLADGHLIEFAYCLIGDRKDRQLLSARQDPKEGG